MIEKVVSLKDYITARERDGLLSAMTAEYLLLALDTLGLGVSGQTPSKFTPYVDGLAELVYSDQFKKAYKYCVEITPALGE